MDGTLMVLWSGLMSIPRVHEQERNPDILYSPILHPLVVALQTIAITNCP
jgi:hypothetical protein